MSLPDSSTTPQAPNAAAQQASLPAQPQPTGLDGANPNTATSALAQQPPTGLGPNGAPEFPQLSDATKEILKRVAANGAGNPGWEAAREQVLQRMVTTQNMATTPPTTTPRGRARGGANSANTNASASASTSAAKAETPSTNAAAGASTGTGPAANAASPPTSGRGRGGRGRGGGGRGGKRKRAKKEDDDEDDGDSSDNTTASETLTPLPTKTKSGRRVHRPTHYDPATKTPTRRRGPYRRHAEATVCKICQRGHSPQSNMIVFCDGCNTPYHQYCHDPPIADEVVKVEEKEWFCSECIAARRDGSMGVSGEVDLRRVVSGEGLSMAEKRAYLTRLSQSSLISLLLHATTNHPTLPIFPPDVKSLVSNATTTSNTTTPAAVANHIDVSPPANSALSQTMKPAAIQPTAQDDHPMEDAPSEPAPLNTFQSLSALPASSQFPRHPRPGNGIRLPPESEDLPWLIDDDFIAFSHIYKEVMPQQGLGPGHEQGPAQTVTDTEMTGGDVNEGSGLQQQQQAQSTSSNQVQPGDAPQLVGRGAGTGTAEPGEGDEAAGVGVGGAAGRGGRVSVGA